MTIEINPARQVVLEDMGEVAVGKVLCIGRNYARHAAEMNSPVPSTPMVFLKPATALTGDGTSVVLPSGAGSVHHEVELVAVVGQRLRFASVEEAEGAIAGYAVGLDMTARDVQAKAKKSGAPWSVAKGYDTFAPLGAVSPASTLRSAPCSIRLHVNGRLVQSGFLSDMVFSIPELLAYCSTIFTLEPGDLLFSGTPEGVGPVTAGDELLAEIDGLAPLRVSVRPG